MFIPPVVHAILMYGGLLLAAGSVLAFYLRDVRKERAGNLPVAALAKRRRSLMRYAPILGLLIGSGLSLAMWTHCEDLVVVSDGDNGLVAERTCYFGSTMPYGVRSSRMTHGTHPTWVVNHSKRLVKVKTVSYGLGLSFGDTGEAVLPGTAEAFNSIDFIGQDAPPNEIRDDSGIGVASRSWLTW